MAPVATSVWLIAGYSVALLVTGWAFDVMARHASSRAAQWRTGQFVYRPDHDAWVCPQDHWLWPSSFDPKHRVMRYRALPVVCNSCPVKADCTNSSHGREVSRDVDPWPHSDAGRFHRGIACCVAALGVVLPLATSITNHSVGDLLVLAATVLVVVTLGLPLARHLWNTPSNAPEHLPHRTAIEDQAAATIDRYSSRWGSWDGKKEESQ
ncbi:hypothetical protein [Mycobacterium sherrisii]|uniref:Transposase DDE domain-containing protein n=1 Tax=Mycobacterium sherrisii TaxID=243061 RepID=A0A1E3SGR9_9MYCO|nr:hypothetical protein [Mycobacterium sherrisii]MCV7030849.1 hypothetical protein [Mycobacterium sherrisii]ODR01262.1 hypothetical protein BHQ21_23650 [Mycobacterium sherrisii]ORW74708.1 hypothetical protein AWC25_15900 [Mycobacterium sherrisii]